MGIVTVERHIKSSSLFQMPLPASDSDEALLLDIMGVLRTITIEGTKEGTVVQINTFIDLIEGMENGVQTQHTFTSSILDHTLDVLINEFNWWYEGGNPNILYYTLSLIQGKL